MVSRFQVATYVADHLKDDRRKTLRSASAWLAARGRGRQAEYLARDVAQILGQRGYVYAEVTTAREISDNAKHEVKEFIKENTRAHEIELVTKVDTDLIGGALIELPDAELDGTVKTKLAKFVEGVSL
jgi:F0F1-type ATP synthase delta subunit